MKNEFRCSFCGKWQRDVRRLIAGPKVYICDECVQLCCEIIEEEACAYVERHLRHARKELEGVRAELKSALSERSDLERVAWLARHPDASRVAIMARHFANASQEAIDVPRALADRARALAEELEALVRS